MRPSRGRLVAFLLLSVAQTLSAGVVHAAPFQLGDIFAAVGDSDLNGTSEVRRYNAAGVLQETLQLTGASNRSTGMAFDSAGNLYATGFDSNVVKKFDSNGALLGNFGSGYATPESIVFDNAGNVYVSNVSDGGIRKFDAAGNFITTILPGVRVDWMDLAADQTTMLYSQEGSPILRVNVSTNTALSNFVATGGLSFALRILPDGSVLVANGGNIKLYNSSAALVRTYDVAGEDLWFALNLNPDGTSFWSGNLQTGNLYEFDIACGFVANCTTFTQFLATGVPNQQPTRALAGVAIFGERTVGCPTCFVPVAEPTSLALLGLGLTALATLAWRRRR